MSLLDVRDLTIDFPNGTSNVRAVDSVSFSAGRGDSLGIVGESGSGKSVSCLAIMGLLPTAHVTGSIRVDGVEVVGANRATIRRLRGRKVAMIFQDPMSSLHPQYRIGEQIAEARRLHFGESRRAAHAQAVRLLGEVGIPHPSRRADDHPHQFSGGMRQRVMIAIALACEPDLLIADEPTTALDVTVQDQILDLIAAIQQERDVSVIMISHDLGVIARVADDVLVMYAGHVVERAPADDLYTAARHPYTRGLLASLPRLDDAVGTLMPIPGSPPSLLHRPTGCPFHPRCPQRFAGCDTRVPPLTGDARHLAACHLLSREDAAR